MRFRDYLGGLLTLLVASTMLAACDPKVEQTLADLSQFTRTDVQYAYDLAKAASDPSAPYRARCYATLLKYVPEGSTVGQALLAPKGLVSAYEIAAEVDAKLKSGVSAIVPVDVHADCSVLVTDAKETALRLGLKMAPLPGAGIVGGFLR